jgi:hypothetical protein
MFDDGFAEIGKADPAPATVNRRIFGVPAATSMRWDS